MKVIFDKVIKNKVSVLIKFYGITINELLIDLPLNEGFFHSIEWVKKDKKIYLHQFDDYDFDFPYDFDDLSEDDKLRIYQILSSI